LQSKEIFAISKKISKCRLAEKTSLVIFEIFTLSGRHIDNEWAGLMIKNYLLYSKEE